MTKQATIRHDPIDAGVKHDKVAERFDAPAAFLFFALRPRPTAGAFTGDAPAVGNEDFGAR